MHAVKTVKDNKKKLANFGLCLFYEDRYLGKFLFIGLGILGLGYGFARLTLSRKDKISSNGKRAENRQDLTFKKEIKYIPHDWKNDQDIRSDINRFADILQVRFRMSQWNFTESLKNDYDLAIDLANDEQSMIPLYDFWVIDNNLLKGEEFVSTFIAFQRFDTDATNWVSVSYNRNLDKKIKFGGYDSLVELDPLQLLTKNGKLILADPVQDSKLLWILNGLRDGGVKVVMYVGADGEFPKNMEEFLRGAFREYGIPHQTYSEAMKELTRF